MSKRPLVALVLACLVGCPANADDGDAHYGPPDAMLTFDASQVPLSPADAGSPSDAVTPTKDSAVAPDVALDVGATHACLGTPTPCSLLSSASCIGTMGCSRSGSCGGYARSCYSQFSSYSCTNVHGCYWDYTANSCSGSSTGCVWYSDSYSCIDQPGCSWTDSCTGVARSCAGLDSYLCATQPGCTWL